MDRGDRTIRSCRCSVRQAYVALGNRNEVYKPWHKRQSDRFYATLVIEHEFDATLQPTENDTKMCHYNRLGSDLFNRNVNLNEYMQSDVRICYRCDMPKDP